MKDTKSIKQLESAVKKAIRRMNIITKKNIGTNIHPLIRNPNALLHNTKYRPEDPMVTVTYNVRTRYDF
jgi:hypothetical protein